MSSRITNSESQRGIKGETLPQTDNRERHSRPRKDSHSSFHGANPSRWPDVEANNGLKSDDCSTWPSWEASPEDNDVKRDEDISDMRHKIPADPAFDGRRQQHHSRPLNDSWSQPQRVRGSDRSRDRDGSRSRSRSRGKGRSRSRSRSWDRGEGGGRGRSRSPFQDDRHESNANINRVSGPMLSSRVCRDFAMGKCRRGSNCRFPHQENLNSQGGRRSDNDVTQRSSSRPEYEGASRYGDNRESAVRLHDKVSDGSRRNSGKDEPDSRERSSSRPDGTRRYPHHVASGDNHNRSNRNASYNHDGKGPPNRNGKAPCKFFPIGKCHREDCRFSHDGPMSEGVDGRSRDDRLRHVSDEKKKSWNGPTWDEVNVSDSSEITNSSRQHGTSGRNLNSYNSTAYDKHMDDKNMSWNGPAWDEVVDPKSSDRGNSSAQNLNYYDTVATGKRTDENKAWDETSAPGLNDTTKSVERGERSESYHRYGQDNSATFDDSNVLDVDMVSEDSTYPVLTPKQVFDQSGHSIGYQSPLNLGGNEKHCPTISPNPLNLPNVDLSGSVHGIHPSLTQPIRTMINQNEAGEAQELPELGVKQVTPEMSENVVSSAQVAQITDLPAILNQISQNGQFPQIIAALNPNNGMGLVHSIPTSASVVPPFPPVNPMFVPVSMDMQSKEQYDLPRESREIQKLGSNNEPSGVLSTSMGGVPGEEHQRSPKSKQQGPGISKEEKNVEEKGMQKQEKIQVGSSDARGIVEEGSISNDEKAMRLFKIALVDFVKEILKPTWKEGGMSREDHKTIVKKVVDKVTSTVQGIQIPRTPEKIEQYLAFSKSKITKLVAAYVERLSKPAADA